MAQGRLILVWSRDARDDLREACDFIASDNPVAALRVEERVLRATLSLARFPDIGRPTRIAGVRELPVKNTSLIVAYEHRAGEVVILHVRHMARRPSAGGGT